MRTITAGKLKDAGSPFREMSSEERTYFQAMLDDVHGQFIGAVAEARKLPADEVRNKFVLKLWNTYAFFCNYARLDGFDPNATQVPVADRPDIEWCIVAPPSRPSYLAEVVFPVTMTIHEAKEYIFRELGELHEEVTKQLQLPTSNRTVQVYLFEDKERYKRFIHAKYPDLPERRAFFVAQPRGMGVEDLLVYTYWGDQVQQDLRHELTHAVLHAVLKDVPIWLDEGLAEEAAGVRHRAAEPKCGARRRDGECAAAWQHRSPGEVACRTRSTGDGIEFRLVVPRAAGIVPHFNFAIEIVRPVSQATGAIGVGGS